MDSLAISPLRGAVVGYGGKFNMGKHHAEGMIEAGIAFTAACEIDSTRLAQALDDFPGIRAYNKLDDLLAQPDIDIVTVITPHDSHASLASKVLAAGKHCILEKPMCLDAWQAEALVQQAKDAGLMLSVYHNRRWDAWYLTVQDLIAKDLLGDVFSVELFTGGYGHPGHWWRSDKSVSGGIVYDWGAHYADWLLGLVPGAIKSVRGIRQKRLWTDVTNEDQVDGFIAFKSGAVAHLQVSNIALAGKPNRRILGTKGAVVSIGADPYVTLYTDNKGVRMEAKVPHLQDQWQLYYRNIAEHLRNEQALAVTPVHARRIVAVLDTINRSAEEDRELEVPFE